MSELDQSRRQALLDFVRNRIQTFITTTEPDIFAGMEAVIHLYRTREGGFPWRSEILNSKKPDLLSRCLGQTPPAPSVPDVPGQAGLEKIVGEQIAKYSYILDFKNNLMIVAVMNPVYMNYLFIV